MWLRTRMYLLIALMFGILFTTHPNMLKRIKHLSTLTV